MGIQSLSKYSMLVKCEKCGYENFPQHRFCGMCGTALPSPVGPSPRPSPEPPQQTPKPVNRASPAASVGRSSPVALEHERVDPRSVSYLLEDEPAPSHWGRYVLLLVLVAGVAAGWYWRGDLGALANSLRTRAGSAQPNSAATEGSSPSTAPASGANSGTQVEKPSTAARDQAPAPQAQTPPASPPPPTGAPNTTDSTQAAQPDQPQPANQAQTSESAANTAKPDDSADAASQPAPVAAPPKLRTRPATAATARADDTEAEGEKYLYGNGAPENCTRARKNLLAAAQHNNAKAQNVLGTMYATGHCATRDLPTAYRWFGRSLRQDPSNTRIEQDLKVLWSQMTPEEQRLALRDTH